jgi:hypothetical protein
MCIGFFAWPTNSSALVWGLSRDITQTLNKNSCKSDQDKNIAWQDKSPDQDKNIDNDRSMIIRLHRVT